MLSGFFVTKKGKNLLAKTHDGVHIKLTKAEIGNGDVPEGQLITDVSSLYGKVKELGLKDVRMISGNTACVPVQFTNKGILTSFELKEIGIYALDPDEGEILYLYGNTSATGDKPDEIKSESEAPLEYLFNLNLSFEDGTEVEVDVNNGILYVTKQELIDMADTKVDKVSGKGLSTEDYTTAEKTKLAGIAAGANNYVHPSTHPSTMITGLGTAATKNTGTVSGSIPLIGSDGLLPTSVLPPPLTVENVLTSISTVNALSAAQGKVLNDAKVDKVSGKGLSTNDYTTAEKSKLAGIAAGANNYTHPTTHSASMITGLPSSLPANGGTADKVANKLTAGSKSYDGSAAVTLTAADLGALTSIPATYVTETEYATTSKGGVVKSSTAVDKISVGTDGIMSVNTVNASKITGTLAIAKGGTGATTAAQALTNLGVTYGTADLTAGTSALTTGAIYLVYE